MAIYLGFDTSNYKTSAALFDSQTGKAWGESRFLQVPEGSLGLRQSEALFQHVRSLGRSPRAFLKKPAGFLWPLWDIPPAPAIRRGPICPVSWRERWRPVPQLPPEGCRLLPSPISRGTSLRLFGRQTAFIG